MKTNWNVIWKAGAVPFLTNVKQLQQQLQQTKSEELFITFRKNRRKKTE